MKRIPPSRNADPDDADFYADFDPDTGRRGSVPPAQFFNDIQSELLNAIDGSGLTVAEADLTQLLQAIKRLRNNQIGFQAYTTAGTYTFTVPAGVTKLFLDVIGAGGGGGSTDPADNRIGGCGGAGGRSRGVVTVTPGQTITVTVGAGGDGAAAGGNDGSPGGTSSFGAYMSATGGKPGYGTKTSLTDGSNTSLYTVSGIGSGGAINEGLGDGSRGWAATGGTVDIQTYGGTGGGPGGRSGWVDAPSGRGPGGGGASVGGNNISSVGGDGADGAVIIHW